MTETASIDVVEMTLEGAHAAFARGISSEALTQAFLDRIATYNGHYNAIIFFNPDALADARAVDARRAAGEALGPLAGVPVVVKDPMDMVGFPTTAGWSLLHSKTGGVDLMPGTDAPVVARMRAAGAIILGKTNVSILSHTGAHANGSWAGPTYNAAGREFLPGGSSAGTACAVASSMAVLGLAEETGGSIQNPASAQALVGIKPTFALVPNAGVMPLASMRDVVGPIARCSRDAHAGRAGRLHDGGPQDRRRHRPQAGGRLRLDAWPRRAARQADRAVRLRLARPAAVCGGNQPVCPGAERAGGAGRRPGRGPVRGHGLRRPAHAHAATGGIRCTRDGVDPLRPAAVPAAPGSRCGRARAWCMD